MSFSDIELLRHIHEELVFIDAAIGNKSKVEVIGDPILSRAIVRSLEIIGEPAKKVSQEFKSRYSTIEWKKISGTRDRLIHEYFGVDYDIVWDILENKLPGLRLNVSEILSL